MEAESGAGDKPGPYSTEKQREKARSSSIDAIGIAMGVPVFLAGLWFVYLALQGPFQMRAWLLCALLVAVSVGLFIPSRVYEHKEARVVGLVAMILATAATAACAGFTGIGIAGVLSDIDYEFAGLVALISVGGLILSVFAFLCTRVLALKIRPRRAHAAAAIAAGILVGALLVLGIFVWEWW